MLLIQNTKKYLVQDNHALTNSHFEGNHSDPFRREVPDGLPSLISDTVVHR